MKLRTLLLLPSLLSIPSALAQTEPRPGCHVFAGDLYSVYDGYPIVYEDAVTRILTQKGYRLVFREEIADFVLTITTEARQKGRFEFATASFAWRQGATSVASLERSREKRCWTDLCAVQDFLSPLRKLFKAMSETLPDCGSGGT